MLFRFYLLFATLVVPLLSVAQNTLVKSMMAKTTIVKSTISPSKKLTTCMDHYPPYQYTTGIPTGIHVDSMKKLAELFNRELIILKSPNFARCLAMLKAGKVDVIAGTIKSSQREKYAFFAPYRKIDKLILVSKKQDLIMPFTGFSNKIIGIPRGTNYYAKFDNDNTLIKIEIPSVEAGIKLVEKGRIDGLLTSNLVLEVLINESQTSTLQFTEIQREDRNKMHSYFAFSKKNTLGIPQSEIVAIVTAAFQHDVFKAH